MKVKIAELNKLLREIRRDINYNINEKQYEELLDSFGEYDDLVDQLVDKLKIYKYKNKNLKNKLEKFKTSNSESQPKNTEPSVIVESSTADMIDVTSTPEYQELLAKYNSLLEENKKLKTENTSKGVGKDIAEENRLRKMIGEKDKQVNELMAYIKELEEKIPKPDPNLLQIR